MFYDEWKELEEKVCHVKIVAVRKSKRDDTEYSVEFELIETGEFFTKTFYEED